MKTRETIPFMAVPVGWMPCVACRDFRTQPGKMWLGYSRTGEDLVITCPVCKGKAQIERLKYFDVRTGKEIDYERPGQKLVMVSQHKALV
jgi:hypothetical protein